MSPIVSDRPVPNNSARLAAHWAGALRRDLGWHEFVLTPGRLIDHLCERASVLEADKASEGGKAADEMAHICHERRPIIEGP
jgi:hypothetical protein